jgi:hypothetical protein
MTGLGGFQWMQELDGQTASINQRVMSLTGTIIAQIVALRYRK